MNDSGLCYQNRFPKIGNEAEIHLLLASSLQINQHIYDDQETVNVSRLEIFQ